MDKIRGTSSLRSGGPWKPHQIPNPRYPINLINWLPLKPTVFDWRELDPRILSTENDYAKRVRMNWSLNAVEVDQNTFLVFLHTFYNEKGQNLIEICVKMCKMCSGVDCSWSGYPESPIPGVNTSETVLFLVALQARRFENDKSTDRRVHVLTTLLWFTAIHWSAQK